MRSTLLARVERLGKRFHSVLGERWSRFSRGATPFQINAYNVNDVGFRIQNTAQFYLLSHEIPRQFLIVQVINVLFGCQNESSAQVLNAIESARGSIAPCRSRL